MATIGTILLIIGGIASFVFWLKAVILAFKSGDTVWGILGILFSIPALIYLFVKGHTKAGILYLAANLVAGIGYALWLPSLIAQMQQQMPAQLPQ